MSHFVFTFDWIKENRARDDSSIRARVKSAELHKGSIKRTVRSFRVRCGTIMIGYDHVFNAAIISFLRDERNERKGAAL